MAVLAFIPGASAMVVAARSTVGGFRHGASASAGIVLGDVVFILVAVLGLSVLAETMGGRFVLVQYVGGACLLWLGAGQLRSKPAPPDRNGAAKPSLFSSFVAGLFITLADQKAVLFYLGFFPAFMDLTRLTGAGIAVVVLISALAVGGPKLCYAGLASLSRQRFNTAVYRGVNIAAGAVMIGVGVLLIIKAVAD
jgi:threonine/homoserine/homoserine lactone efflux protein